VKTIEIYTCGEKVSRLISLLHYFDEAGTQIPTPLITLSYVGIPSLQISARTYALAGEVFTACGQWVTDIFITWDHNNETLFVKTISPV
jgi:hypothetical protein